MAKLSFAFIAALVASATAFAPQKSAQTKSSLKAAEIWDPMGLYELGSGESFDTFPGMFPDKKSLQVSEIKHGRMAMLAWTGVWATTKGGLGLGLHFPGFPEDPDWTTALGTFSAEQPVWFGAILASIFILEGESISGDNLLGKNDEGNINLDVLGLKKKLSAEKYARYADVEMKNGRAAMIAMASLFAFKAIPGSVPIMDLLGAQ